MFGIPGDVFWPTAAFGTIVVPVFTGVALLRLWPRLTSRVVHQPDREALEDLLVRLGQLDRLQDRVSELEERVDFAERILGKQRESERLGAPRDPPIA